MSQSENASVDAERLHLSASLRGPAPDGEPPLVSPASCRNTAAAEPSPAKSCAIGSGQSPGLTRPTASPGSRGEREQPHKRRPRLLSNSPLSSTLCWYEPPRRPYTRRELLADRIINFGGAGLSWFGAPALAFVSWYVGDSFMKQLGFWAFGLGLMTMLTCSAFFHFFCWRWDIAQQLLGLDHIGISSMIMGSYVPVMQMLGAWKTLIVVLSLGVIGWLMEAHKFFASRWPQQPKESRHSAAKSIFNALRYLVMGWACLPVVGLMYAHLPRQASIFYLAGGLTYSLGVPAFIRHGMEFHQPAWHLAVMMASIFFYIGNFQLVGLPLP